MPHTLIVMRHAKSSWRTAGPDHQRPLTKRGIRDATAAGELLAGYRIDLVLSSSATRTQETWRAIERAGATAGQVDVTDALYGAWTDTIVGLLRSLEESVGSAMVLGHEPSVSDVVGTLAAPSALTERAADHFPTSAVAILEVPTSWADLSPGAASLVRFEIPRG